jgi:aldose sugar dehydrogenase
MSARAPRRAALGGLLLLAACGGAAPPAEPPSAGRRLYVTHCLACHQPQGEGLSGVQPPLAGTPVPNGDPEALARWVMFGLRPPALPRGRYSGVMPQFAYLSDADLATLLSYVRSHFGNHAPPVPEPLVAAVRSSAR